MYIPVTKWVLIIVDSLKSLKISPTERKSVSSLILRLDTVNLSSFPILHQRGFWANSPIRRSLWRLTLLIWQLTLVAAFVTLWVQIRIKTFFRRQNCKVTLNRLLVGGLTLMVNTLLLVSEVLLLVAGLTCLLLTILIRNRMLKLGEPTYFFLLGSGFSLVLSSVLCPVVRSLS